VSSDSLSAAPWDSLPSAPSALSHARSARHVRSVRELSSDITTQGAELEPYGMGMDAVRGGGASMVRPNRLWSSNTHSCVVKLCCGCGGERRAVSAVRENCRFSLSAYPVTTLLKLVALRHCQFGDATRSAQQTPTTTEPPRSIRTAHRTTWCAAWRSRRTAPSWPSDRVTTSCLCTSWARSGATRSPSATSSTSSPPSPPCAGPPCSITRWCLALPRARSR
jgi:hypothetical protein